MKWNHSAMPTSVYCDQKLQWRIWPDKSLAFYRLDLLLVADAEWALGTEGHGQCIGNACFPPRGSDTNCSCLSKENHRVTHELTSAVPTLTPAMRWRKTSLYLPPLAGWQSRWGCEHSPWGIQTLKSSCGSCSIWQIYFQEMGLLRISRTRGYNPFQN